MRHFHSLCIIACYSSQGVTGRGVGGGGGREGAATGGGLLLSDVSYGDSNGGSGLGWYSGSGNGIGLIMIKLKKVNKSMEKKNKDTHR